MKLPIRSYKSAFVLLFLVLLVITVLSVALNAYRRAARVSLDLSVELLAEVSEKLVDRAVEVFDDADDFLVMNQLAIGDSGIIMGSETLAGVFATQLRLAPRLQSLYAADAQGSFVQVRRLPQLATRIIDRTDEDAPVERLIYRGADFQPIAHINGGALFDPRKRAWYRGALASGGEPFATDVYRFETGDVPGITLARAVLDAQGRPRGVLGADITLASLSELLSDQRLIPGAVPLIVGGDDRLLAYPFAQTIRPGTETKELPRVDDLEARWLRQAYHSYHDGRARIATAGAVDYAQVRIDGASYITHRMPLPSGLGDDTALYIVVPETALLTSARRLLSESAVISLIILCLSGLAVWALARRLFVPLVQLDRNTRRIKAFRFDEVERVHSQFREIQSLDEAIWSIQQGLRSLEKFVPADVARELVASGEDVRPGVEVRELAFFFTGIAQLAELCRTLPPERIGAVLSGELDQFTGIILRLRGTIDNYLGESIMAFWGAPLPAEDGAERACRAALKCRSLEDELADGWDHQDLAPPRNLYSVHYGPAIVGNIGSSKRMSYTALGDNVTLGWELRRLNHRYGTRIIVSEPVQQRVADQFWFRRLDQLPPTGKNGPMSLFELIGERDRPLSPAQAAFIDRYQHGLVAILRQRWSAAEQFFEQLAAEYPLDPSVALMLGRCAAQASGYCELMDPLAGAAGTQSPIAGAKPGD